MLHENALDRRSFLIAAGAATAAGLTATPARATDARPFRIGIVGSQNSHSDAYASLINLEGAGKTTYGEIRVTHLWGEEAKRSAEVAAKCKIPTIVDKVEEMIGQVDGVICVRRHGGKHLEDAMPFLKAGIPVYVDKPLACSVADARAMIAAAKASHVGFSSFSTLRFAPETTAYIDALRKDAGALSAGTSTGHCEPDSEYGGIFFYGIHAVELASAVFGYGCESVLAQRHGPNVTAICTYPNNLSVTLQLLGEAKYVFHLSAYGKDGWKDAEVGTGSAYAVGMNVILATLIEQAWPIDEVHLVEPIQILAATELSLKENRKVTLAELG